MTRLAVDIPVIETDRLILREPRVGDLDAVAAFMASDRARFVGGPGNRFEAWRALTSAVGCWIVNGYGTWTLEDRASWQVAGRVGVIRHEGWPEPELGWHIYDGFEGQGLAHEAALAARAAAARHFGLTRLISLIDAANVRSLRLAERLGARFERDGEVLGKPCQIWRHPEVQA